MTHSWERQIETALPTLPAAMQRVARYILKHQHRAAELQLTNLSRETGVSKTTIVRMCQALGYGGYKDFYAAWISAVTQQTVPQEATDESLIKRVFSETIKDLERTSELLERAALSRAEALIDQASTLYFYALGDSEGVALIAAHRFMILGKPSRVLASIEDFYLSGALFQPRDVIVVISQSGFQPHRHALAPVKEFRPEGNGIIAITSNPKTALVKHAEVVLQSSASDLGVAQRTVTLRASHLAIIDTLAFSYALRWRNDDLHGLLYERGFRGQKMR